MNNYLTAPSLEELRDLDFSETRFEPGYMFVCALCNFFTPDFWLLQIVMAAITNISIFIFLYRYCKNPFVGITIYLFLSWLYFNTEIMRESAAIGIFLLNYKNLEKKRWIRYYLISLLSISFHYSAIIIWLFPLVRFLKFNVVYILICILLISITPFFQQLNELITITSINNRMDMYLDGNGLNLNWRLSELIRSAIIPVTGLIIASRKHLNIKFRDVALLQILFCAGAFAIPIIFSRFTNYTIIFVIAFVSNILSSKYVKYRVKTCLVAIILLSQAQYYFSMYQRWIPYVSVFNPVKVEERELLWWQFNH